MQIRLLQVHVNNAELSECSVVVCTDANYVFEKLDLCLNIPLALSKTVHRINLVRLDFERVFEVFLSSIFFILGKQDCCQLDARLYMVLLLFQTLFVVNCGILYIVEIIVAPADQIMRVRVATIQT